MLDEAVYYAERAGCHYTGTDHLILTLTQHRQGALLLDRFGVDVEHLYETVEFNTVSPQGFVVAAKAIGCPYQVLKVGDRLSL